MPRRKTFLAFGFRRNPTTISIATSSVAIKKISRQMLRKFVQRLAVEGKVEQLVPYIDLGPEYDVDRAAEVKNFDKDAEEAYNEARDAKIAAGKNPGKEWDELAFDTRRNKRYEAIREYEAENGAGTAYRQVKSTEKY